MLSDAITSIRLHLDELLTTSKSIDVDSTADKLIQHFPSLSIDELKEKILEVIVAAGGNASWGKRG